MSLSQSNRILAKTGLTGPRTQPKVEALRAQRPLLELGQTESLPTSCLSPLGSVSVAGPENRQADPSRLGPPPPRVGFRGVRAKPWFGEASGSRPGPHCPGAPGVGHRSSLVGMEGPAKRMQVGRACPVPSHRTDVHIGQVSRSTGQETEEP